VLLPDFVRTIAKRLPLAGLVRSAWKIDVDHSAEQLRKDIARLARTVDRLAADQTAVNELATRMERHAAQIKEASRLNDRHRDILATLDSRLDPARVIAHVKQSIAAARLQMDPFPHIVAESLMPTDVYRLVRDAIPSALFFSQADPVKQNIRIPMDFAPALSTRAWDFVDVVSREAIRPAVMEKFWEPLEQHLEAIFGAKHRAAALAMPQSVTGGRLMLRREGYHLDPHRDPKRVMVTCLLYFARPHDSEAFGTQTFRVHGDTEASYQETFYPAEQGGQCKLVKVVPFRPNTALMFLNSGGAHGVDIPDTLHGVERHSFQFYIGPDQDTLEALVARLPPERQALWRERSDAKST
jgi:hypothetical protein